jgi:pimeloyl-ACP methyl ester carboxylesterase
MDVQELEVRGYGGEPLPCLLHGGSTASAAAVVLPGAGHSQNRLGGTPARPDLHFTRALLQQVGLAVLEVWWDADRAPAGDVRRWVSESALAAVGEARRRHPVRVLVGRSMGTGGLAALLAESDYADMPTVWLAPLVRTEWIRVALATARGPCLVVGGTADESFDVEFVRSIESARTHVVLLDGAHHGLAVDDPVESLRLLEKMLESIHAFLEEHVPRTPT